MDSFLLPVDKPVGPTSHDIVNAARRALGTRRIGHTGTLDPFASGLLLLCVEQATRLAEYLGDLPKTYRATARFDGRSPTDDLTGDINFTRSGGVAENAVQTAFATQFGVIRQRPSDYSAKKTGGQKAYDLARRGEPVDLPEKEVTIYELIVHSIEWPAVDFTVRCSSGTYVRAIARDVGEQLGTGGYLVALRRTAIGPFDVSDAVTPDRFAEGRRIALLDAIAHLARVQVDAAQARALRFGQAIDCAAETGTVAVALEHELVAIALSDGQYLKPRKVFGV